MWSCIILFVVAGFIGVNAVRRTDSVLEGKLFDVRSVTRDLSSASSTFTASHSGSSTAFVNTSFYIPSPKEKHRRSSFELLWDLVKLTCNPMEEPAGEDDEGAESMRGKSSRKTRSISDQFRTAIFGKSSSHEGNGNSLQKTRDEAEPDYTTSSFRKTWRKMKKYFERDQRMIRFLRRTFWMTKSLRAFNEYVLTQDRAQKDSAFESFRQYTEDREKAKWLLQSDFLFGVIHIMVQETCWSACVERLAPAEALIAYKKAHLSRDALSLMLEEMTDRQEWPIAAKQKAKS